jgi:hypothetical protein
MFKRSLSLDNAKKLFDRRFYWILFALTVILAAYAWSRRFILDDTLISFRCAKNLVESHGPLILRPREKPS